MGKLAEQISSECCGNLMEIGAKQLLVAEVAEVEHLYEVRCQEVIELELEIVELKEAAEYEMEKRRYGV